MESDHINLVKLCVGTDTVEDLETWQESRRASLPGGLPRHVTRMWPRRADKLLRGGSLYWVFRGLILARQKVLRLDEAVGDDGITRCAIVLDPHLVRTEPVPRRPFQGWRYLPAEQTPRDLPAARRTAERLPAALESALAEIGVR